MEEKMNLKIDPNLDGPEKLQLLPGVGPELAIRIHESRPFESLEDLQQVRGVGAAFVDRWKGMLQLSPVTPLDRDIDLSDTASVDTEESGGDTPDVVLVDEVEKPEMVVEPVLVEAHVPEEKQADAEMDEQAVTDQPEEVEESMAPEKEQAVVETDEQAAPDQADEMVETVPVPAPAAVITRSGAIWGMIITGFLSMIFSVVLTLGILAGSNSGLLQLAKPSDVNTLSTQTKSLGTSLDQVGQDVQGLRDRLDNLEGLSSRISTVEKSTSDLQEGFDATKKQLDTINTGMDGLQTQVDQVAKQGEQFSQFLSGLQNLLNDTFSPEGATP